MPVKTNCSPKMEVIDGDFSSDAGWDVRPDWTISGGKAVSVSTAFPPNALLSQILTFQAFHTYRFRVDIDAILVSGINSFVVEIAGEIHNFTTTGTKTFYITIGEVPTLPESRLLLYLISGPVIGTSVTIDNMEVIDLAQQTLCVFSLSTQKDNFFTTQVDNSPIYTSILSNRLGKTSCLVKYNADNF